MKLPKLNSHMVRVYDNVFTEEMGDALVQTFEHTEHGQEYIDNNHKPCFTQLNINEHHPEIVRFLSTGLGLLIMIMCLKLKTNTFQSFITWKSLE